MSHALSELTATTRNFIYMVVVVVVMVVVVVAGFLRVAGEHIKGPPLGDADALDSLLEHREQQRYEPQEHQFCSRDATRFPRLKLADLANCRTFGEVRQWRDLSEVMEVALGGEGNEDDDGANGGDNPCGSELELCVNHLFNSSPLTAVASLCHASSSLDLQ
ncbi:hypothetical protein BHM03_00045922 [Ensete ventricosum]|nr:hypothetical protein BHM03_00045922 [Ensete ventricosum]